MTVWGCQLKPKVYKKTLEDIVLLLEKIWLNSQKTPVMKPYIQPQIEIRQVAEKKISYGNQDQEKLGLDSPCTEIRQPTKQQHPNSQHNHLSDI